MIQHLQCSVFDTYASIIAHQVNCQGVMGSGVAAQVKRKYPEAYRAYKDFCDENAHYKVGLLGKAQLCTVSYNPDGTPRIYVANLFGQLDYGRNKCYVYTDYVALRQCLTALSQFAKQENLIIAMPYKMGCDRGNGDWDRVVYPMIEEIFAQNTLLICRLERG